MKIAFENKQAQQEAQRQFEAGAPAINEVIQQWNALDVGSLDNELMQELLRTPDVGSVVKRGLIASFQEDDLKIAGRKVTRETMAQMVQPFDLSGLQAAVAEAAQQFGAFTLGSIINGKFQLDKAKVDDLKKSNQVLTDDNKTLAAVQQIIAGLQTLFDSGKLDRGVTHLLVKAHIIDGFAADGLQPNRNLFTQNN